ncbi:MAG: hypothetical protein KDD33_00205 [Bdellovibrionales bacterium]|nr:hypothetical protein [Bdellovibrionales bacterium]
MNQTSKKKIVIAFTLAFVSASVFLSFLIQLHLSQPLTQFQTAMHLKSQQILEDQKKIMKLKHPLCEQYQFRTSCFKKVLQSRLPFEFPTELMLWSLVGKQVTDMDKGSHLLKGEKIKFYVVENILLPWLFVDFSKFFVAHHNDAEIVSMSRTMFKQAKARVQKMVKSELSNIKTSLAKRQPGSLSWEKDYLATVTKQLDNLKNLEHP